MLHPLRSRPIIGEFLPYLRGVHPSMRANTFAIKVHLRMAPIALRPPLSPPLLYQAEESRVAEARSKLRAKARSRFLQRREEALMGFEVSGDGAGDTPSLEGLEGGEIFHVQDICR